MAAVVRGVILVGHGGIPKGCPQELVTKLKRLEAQRRAAGAPISEEERELAESLAEIRRGEFEDGFALLREIKAQAGR